MTLIRIQSQNNNASIYCKAHTIEHCHCVLGATESWMIRNEPEIFCLKERKSVVVDFVTAKDLRSDYKDDDYNMDSDKNEGIRTMKCQLP